MKSIRLSIDDLNLPETQERVKEQLIGIIGVQDVTLSEGQNYLDVQFDEQTSVQEISSHLQNNGYKIADML